MKAIIRVTNLSNSTSVLKMLDEVINSNASLQKKIIENGVLLAALRPEEVKTLTEQLAQYQYSTYQATGDSVRLNADGDSTDELIKILFMVLGQEGDLAKTLWTRGLSLETLPDDQAADLKKVLEAEGAEVSLVDTSQLQFVVSGRVRRSDNTPVGDSGYTIRAFDVAPRANRRISLGAPVALQPDGAYSISYEWESTDGRNGPNLLVHLLNPQNQIVAENRREFASRIETLNLEVDVNDPLPHPEPEDKHFVVHGTIRSSDGSTLPGIMVRAFDRDMRSEEPLGQAVTDAKGFYEIIYTRNQFQRAEKERADLLVKVFDNAEQELAANEIIFNAGHIEVVNFVLEDELSLNGTECERYNQELQPLLEQVALRELTHEDIYFLHRETGISLLHLKFLQLDDAYRQSFKTSNCLFYGLFRQGLTVNLQRLMVLEPEQIREAFKKSIGENIISSKLEDDLEQLLKAFHERNLPEKGDVQSFGSVAHLSPEEIKKENPVFYEKLVQLVKDNVKDNLETYFKDSSDNLRYYIYTIDFSEVKGSEPIKDYLRRDVQQHKVSQSAVLEGLTKTKDWKGPETIDAVLLPTVPINQNPLFQPYLQQADVFKITGLASLSDAVAQQLAVRNITLYNLGPESIKSLVDEKVISETQGQTLQLNANVFALANSNTALATAIKNRNPNEQINSIADLVSLEEDDWKEIFKNAKVEGNKEEIEKKAKVKQKQIEILYPHEVFKVKSAASENPEVRGLMQNFYTANDQLNFLHLNYDLDSDDIQQINMANFSEPEQETILNTLKTNKRLYSLTNDAGDTFRLKDAGYDSILKISSLDNETFPRDIDVSAAQGNIIIENARAKVRNLGVAMGNIIDVAINPWTESILGGIGPEPQNYLRRLNGYEDFFGETDYCKCAHCASIISPVAYFVDLMEFLKISVMNRYFPGTNFGNHHLLSPGKRRYDLWNGLKLTCENTHELVPYLTIINEVLENFIFTPEREVPNTALPNRRTIENFVYNLLSWDDVDPLLINSFSQPFHLPLTELEIYLQHFPITRASIAQTLLAYVDDPQNILPQAALKLSQKEYALILDDRSSNNPENRTFLRNLYGVTIPSSGTIPRLNVQDLLKGMEIERSEFTQLIATYFVTAGFSETPRVVGERESGSLQKNAEYLAGSTAGILDRMHRFIRLWRQLDWSITDLDMVVKHLHQTYEIPTDVLHNLLPEQIVKLIGLQKSLKISVNELCTLIHETPTAGSPSFFDERFNLSAFIREDSDLWSPADPLWEPIEFQHPSNMSATTGTMDEDTFRLMLLLLHRLLAGLGINDEELFLLTEKLQGPLGAESDGTFTLNVQNLSLLYRHGLLLKKYKLSVQELFFLIRIHPAIAADNISGLADIEVFVELMAWQKASAYSVKELAFILNEPLTKEVLFSEPDEMAYDIWSQIQADQSLLFADTLFSYFEGITEDQSRAIINANNAATVTNGAIIQADIQKYSLSAATADPATFNLAIPPAINENLETEQRIEVTGALLNVISDALLSAGNPINGDALEGTAGLSAEESQQILNHVANRNIFESVPGADNEFQLTADVQTNPSRLGFAIPDSIIWTTLSAEEQLELYSALIDRTSRYMQPGAPEVSDRLFVGIADLTLVQSNDILSTNTLVFEEIESEKLFWLSPDFDPGTMINVPVAIPLPASEAQKMLLTKHVSEAIPNIFSGQLGISKEKIKALAVTGGYDFNDDAFSASLTRVAHGTEPLTVLEQLTGVLQKMSVWFKDRIFDAETLAFIAGHSGGESQLFKISAPGEFRSPALAHLQETEEYRWLRKKLPGNTEAVEALHEVLTSYGTVPTLPKFADTDTALENLADILYAEESLIVAINNLSIYEGVGLFPATDVYGNTSNQGLKALHKFKDVVDLVQYLGIGAEVLPLFISSGFGKLAAAVQAVVAAIRTKYDTEEEWKTKIGPFEDRIREKKRDALTDYLMHTFRSTLTTDRHWFRTTHDLYNYFLIDTELEGCARTSRVVAGISSLQLYIQRCLMNLEQSEDGTVHVEPTDIPAGEWEWRKNYRVWEANRKVFLYPENYIEPDLRDNKTELFTELESTLLQQEISSQNALDAYSKYMKGFDEIAKLKIAGSYHHLGILDDPTTIDQQADTLHLFGVTSSEPPVYYYRTIKNIYKKEKNPSKYGILYNPWVKLNLQVPVKKVSPIVYNSKLYVFWVEITTRPKNDMVDGTNQFVGYAHNMSVKFSSLQLDGTWQAPQKIQLNDPGFDRGEGIVWDPLVEPLEIDNWLSFFSAPGVLYPDKEIQLAEIKKKIKGNSEILNSLNERVGGLYYNLTNSDFRGLLKPKYEQRGYDLKQLHLEPKDGYTLKGFNWERIYPIKHRKFLFLANEGVSGLRSVDLLKRDFFNPRLGLGAVNLSTDNRFKQSGSNLKYLKGITPGSYFLSEKILKGEEPIDRYFDTFITEDQNIITDIRGENTEIALVNGALYNASLDINRDTFLIYQHSNSGESHYILKRLGTTLNATMTRKLFEQGVQGLLDVEYQIILGENGLPFSFLPDDLWNDAQKVIDKETPDFTGSLGVYFREIFFHTPFLIANHLNSQNKFADAQRWYHFIFNSTANLMSDEIAELETITDPIERRKMMAKRVWQFIEFRNHTLASWRAQLNNQQAIEAYKKDPFNPHAIARLRLGAYMKCITMKYIDNLIDWGDHLFAQDTMESINEATLLYVMASEILGERPAELGDCEQDTEDETYEGLVTKMEGRECYAFLNEIESSTDNVVRIDPSLFYETVTNSSYSDILTAENRAFGYFGVNYNSYLNTNDDAYVQPVETTTSNLFAFEGVNSDYIGNVDLGANVHGTNFLDDINVGNFNIPNILDLPSFHTSFLKQACIFCIPPNPDLLAYWDRVEDRLFKIRNCMNISGVRRQLALFAPEIDPRLLVRAKAAGLSLDDVLNSINGDLPPYRFAFLLAKAKEYAGALQGFGGALLGALEKKSGEELALLRMRQQDEVLKIYTSKLRDMELAAAEASLEGLLKRQQSIQHRIEYYDNLIGEGLSDLEQAQDVLYYTGIGLKELGVPLVAAASGAAIFPSIMGFSFATPGDVVKETAANMAHFFKLFGELSMTASNIVGKHAGYHRREQGWKFSLQQAENELKEIEPSLVAAEIRRDISIKSRELHEKSIEQHQETYEFYRDKFTNLGLYTYLSTQLQRMFRESYQNAMSLARMAERAYRFERNDDTSVLLKGNYWEGPRAGLLSGEKLMNALRSMELRYMESNTRSMEVDQAFSLTQIDPAALINLKATGICEFTVPELYFDLFYPGQYRRQVKSARLTIPCITGPFSNVSAVMTLKSSYIRKDPKVDEGNSELTLIPPSRSTTVATSTAQNDSGVFKLDFRDERYMPFEGAGAVESTWQIELPKSLRPFDYSTINDVLLHISYTAEYDVLFRENVEKITNGLEDLISEEEFPRMFSLRQEFSQGYHQLLHSGVDTPVSLELGEKHFPLFLQGKRLEIVNAEIKIALDENGFRDEAGEVVIPPSFTLGLKVQGNNTAAGVTPGWTVDSETETIITSDPVSSVFAPFLPVSKALDIQLTISDAGVLAPNDLPPSDPSVLDDHKIKDIYLLLNYRVATPA